MLELYIIGSRAYHWAHVLTALSELRFHAAERDVCFGDFVLVANLEVIGTWIKWEVPGPTLGLGLPLVFSLSLLKTKAIKFIIIRIISYNWQTPLIKSAKRDNYYDNYAY